MRKFSLIVAGVIGLMLGATVGTAAAADGNLACRTKAGAFVRCPEPTTGQVPVADTTQPFGMAWSTTLTANPLIVSQSMDIGDSATDTLTVTSVIDSSLTFDNGASRTISIEAAAAATAGDSLVIASGNGTGAGDKDGGNTTVRAGNAANSGTDGLLYLGNTNTSSVELAASAIATNVNGTLTCDENANLNGAITTVGNAATDTVVLTAVVNSSMTFDNGAARTIGIEAAAAATAGDALTISAGNGTGAGDKDGGAVYLRGGNAANSGADGILYCGDSNTSAVEVATAGIATTVNGSLKVDEATTLDGAVTLGNAAGDDVTFTGSIAGNVLFKQGGDRTLGVASHASAGGDDLTLYAADAFATGGGNGGALYLRSGNADGAGTDGVLYCGDVNTSAVEVATAGIATTVNGSLKVDEATTLDGAVTLGNAAGDDVTVTGSVASDVTFKQGAARAISVASHASGAGNHLSIAPGAAFATSGLNGGNLTLRAGAKDGAGTDGVLSCGDADTSAINIGASTIMSTFLGTLNVDEAATFDGAVTLGNAAGDAITVTGLVSGSVTFLGSAAHSITVDTDDNGAGNNLSIAAGAAFGGAGGNGGDLALNAGAKDGGGTAGAIAIGTTTASAISIGNSATTITTPAGYPMVRKLTHRVQHSDLTDADGEEDEAIAGFPANSCPLYALVEVDTAFSGGTSTAVTVSVGDVAAATEVMAAITVFTGASGFGQGAAGANAGNCVFEAAYSPIARFTCTTDTCLALTAGDAYIHLYYLTMAAVTP